MDVYVNDKRLRLSPSASIGKGGEADVFDIGDGHALKLWKGTDHPDVAGSPDETRAALDRLALLQSKMPQFPRNLPERVVSPVELATDRKRQTILGYTMRLVAGAEPLMSLGEPKRRRALGGEAARRVLCDLWKTVAAVHAAGVILGDFNDLNVLVRASDEAYLVDADSFQFGGFPCPVFTERFVDPLLCDERGSRLALARPFCPSSDWYAFAVMVMTTLLCVGPFGGVYRPKDPSRRVAEPLRPLRRITVFDPEVRYPKPAIPFGVLPDELLHALSAIFERDARAPLPIGLLEGLRWTACTKCGVEHARLRCPACDHGSPREVVVVRGHVKATRRFATSGALLCASLVGDAPAYVVHEGGTYRREDGSTLMHGPLDGLLRFWIQGKTTHVARSGRVLSIREGDVEEEISVDVNGSEPAFAVNDRYRFFVHGGRLFRRAARRATGLFGAALDEPWGDVLAGQTRIWVGERLGFGFYRAGALSVAFTFDTERRGIRDTVRIPWPSGRIIAADATIDEDRVWFFLVFVRAGRMGHLAAVIGADGSNLGAAEAEAGDGSWLGAIGGKRALGGALLTGTSGGLARVELGPGGPAEARRFPDTEPFVHAGSSLLPSRAGLWVVDSRELTMLAMG
jgi:hypothetical protein